MSSESSSNLVLAAIESLKSFDRRRAADLLRQVLVKGFLAPDRWRGVAKLAGTIGEIDIALEAARRLATSSPQKLENFLYYCGELSKYGRQQEAVRILDGLTVSVQNYPAVLHLRGVLASEFGHFDEAEAYLRRALAATSYVPQTWYSLSMIKTFAPGDEDLTRMESILPHMAAAAPDIRVQFLYALGKAHDDAHDPERAYAYWSQGAALMRGRENFDRASWDRFAERLAEDFTVENLGRLQPSQCDDERAIFVTGLPRSGTTLVEQILLSHPYVAQGAEINLLQQALIPAGDYSWSGALAYQGRASGRTDPWGEIGRDYLDLVAQRFPGRGRIVDKTLNHSRFMGLLLHVLPKAKVVWLRRNPEDCAFSCFSTFFASPIPWSWSPADIAANFRAEDSLHRHWTALFPDRILTVPYEELAGDPRPWIRRILAHVGLPEDARAYEPHKRQGTVATASVAQVRQPITTARIGKAATYGDFLKEFRAAYGAE